MGCMCTKLVLFPICNTACKESSCILDSAWRRSSRVWTLKHRVRKKQTAMHPTLRSVHAAHVFGCRGLLKHTPRKAKLAMELTIKSPGGLLSPMWDFSHKV
jgi:hypothetical protein